MRADTLGKDSRRPVRRWLEFKTFRNYHEADEAETTGSPHYCPRRRRCGLVDEALTREVIGAF